MAVNRTELQASRRKIFDADVKDPILCRPEVRHETPAHPVDVRGTVFTFTPDLARRVVTTRSREGGEPSSLRRTVRTRLSGRATAKDSAYRA